MKDALEFRPWLRWHGSLLVLLATMFLAPALRAENMRAENMRAETVGLVKRVSGSVVVERAGKSLPVPLGFALQAGDVLTTAGSASAGIILKDNSSVGVGPNSRYTIARFSFNAKTHEGVFASSLSKGTLSMISGKLARQSPDAVTVQTPATMLGVRGTEFVVEVP